MGMLDGTTIMVTCTRRGLGEALATHMAEAGSQIIVNDIDAALAKQTADAFRTDPGRL